MQLKAKQDKKNDGNERNRLQSENNCMLLYNSMLHSSFGPVWSSLLSQSFRKENSKIGGEARRWGKKNDQNCQDMVWSFSAACGKDDQNLWKLLEKLTIMTHSLFLCLEWWLSYKAGKSQAQGVKMNIFHERSSWTVKLLLVMWTVKVTLVQKRIRDIHVREGLWRQLNTKTPISRAAWAVDHQMQKEFFWACSIWAFFTHTASCVSGLLSLRTTTSTCGKFPWKGYQIFYRKPNGPTPANRLVTAAKAPSFSRR